MLIGILEADTLEKQVEDIHGSYATMCRRLFNQLDTTLSFRNYPVIENNFPNNISECDAYLVTGSQYSANDDTSWINKLKQLIRTLDKAEHPLIGICFGHQIIAKALGGMVSQSSKGWGLGSMSYSVTQQQDWMQTHVEQFKLIISHQDQVQQLPPRARLIAASDFCPIAACQINHHILTFQGHPEFTPDFARHLLDSLEPPVAAEILQRARDQLKEKTDHLLVAQWILDFLYRKTCITP